GREAAVALLVIQQSLRDLDLRLSVLQEDAGTVLVKVQLRKQGQPVVRQRVSLSVGGRLLASSMTSAQGMVEFPRLAVVNIPYACHRSTSKRSSCCALRERLHHRRYVTLGRRLTALCRRSRARGQG